MVVNSLKIIKRVISDTTVQRLKVNMFRLNTENRGLVY